MSSYITVGAFAVAFGTFAFLIRKHSVRTSRDPRALARKIGMPLPSERFYEISGILVGPLFIAIGSGLIIVGLFLSR